MSVSGSSLIVWPSVRALTTCSLGRSLAVIFSHKHRDPCEERFFDALYGVGGPFTLLRLVPPQDLHPDMVNEGIYIMHLRRNRDANIRGTDQPYTHP